MLTSIHIENVALVKSLDIAFLSGFSAFTGETGAGKSIIIDAIGLACGSRPMREVIRTGEQSAVVEALFSDLSDGVLKRCAEIGIVPDEDGYIFVRRTFSSDGKSTVRINGRQVPLSILRDLSAYLINIHGQHDNAELLKPEKHLHILDEYADCADEIGNYYEKYKEYCDIKKELSDISLDEKEKKRLVEILKFQIGEISSAKLKIGEEEKLEAEKKRISNIEKISKSTAAVVRYLYDSPNGNSAVDHIERAIQSLNAIDGIIEETAALSDKLYEIKIELSDIAETVSGFSGDYSENPTAVLDKIEERLDLIYRLKQKYGSDIGEILNFQKECEKKLSDIELSDVRLSELSKKLEEAEKELTVKAGVLSEKRKKKAKELSLSVEAQLQYLDMPGVKFLIDFKKKDGFSQNGTDEVEFLVKINAGEGEKPLSKTASGGELSRLMLAIKSVIAEKDGAETLIFDEIDTGISGKTSRKIGLLLKKLAKTGQVLCVTHSAQIASLSDQHYLVSKSEENGRTETKTKLLSKDDRILETARIIAGINITDAAKNTAKELMEDTDR